MVVFVYVVQFLLSCRRVGCPSKRVCSVSSGSTCGLGHVLSCFDATVCRDDHGDQDQHHDAVFPYNVYKPNGSGSNVSGTLNQTY